MPTTTYHPGLESWVINNDRPFPEITEDPGWPIQTELKEALKPALDEFYNRFSPEQPVPLIVDFGQNSQQFNAVVMHPQDICAGPGHLDRKTGIYKSFHIFAHGAYIAPVLESADFTYTTRNMDIGGDFEAPRYQFGVCGGFGLHFSEFGADNPEGLAKIKEHLAQKFGSFVVDREFSQEELLPIQREHLYWLGVILKGYYLQRDSSMQLTKKRWYSRAPDLDKLAGYRDELANDIPDSNSEELLPVIYALSRRVVDLRHREPHRIGEDYTLVDVRGRPLSKTSF